MNKFDTTSYYLDKACCKGQIELDSEGNEDSNGRQKQKILLTRKTGKRRIGVNFFIVFRQAYFITISNVFSSSTAFIQPTFA